MEDMRQLFHRVGTAITSIADDAKEAPGGDQALFGSTNDLDWLRELRDAYIEFCHFNPKEMAFLEAMDIEAAPPDSEEQ